MYLGEGEADADLKTAGIRKRRGANSREFLCKDVESGAERCRGQDDDHRRCTGEKLGNREQQGVVRVSPDRPRDNCCLPSLNNWSFVWSAPDLDF